MKRNIGHLNNNWKGGHRRDEPQSEPLTRREQLLIKIEVLCDSLKETGIPARFVEARLSFEKQLAEAEKELRELDDPNPLLARRAAILDVFENEPLNKAKASELYTELAEIDASLQFNPSDTLQDTLFARWERLEPIPF